MVAVYFHFNVIFAKAGGASLYLSPNNGTFDVGSTFNVSIFVNTGDQKVNAVKVELKFDPKKLQIAKPTTGKSFISIWIAPPSYSNKEGILTFQGGIPTPGINTSSGLVSTVTFRAIAPGDTKLYFLNASQVLLDDGYGTNVLNSLGDGNYTISILPPEGPEIFSPTHPDLNKWYKNNNPTFSWNKEEGVTDFSYSLDNDSRGVPDNISEGDKISVSFSDLKDGIWYFHAKAKKGNIWGGTSHYVILVDSTPPASFVIKVDPSEKTDVAKPMVSFFTTDSLSETEHYEVKVVDITIGREDKKDSFFIETSSPYQLSSLEIGKYMVVVRAYDRAGNWRDESVKIEIVAKETAIAKKEVQRDQQMPWWLLLTILLTLLILILLILIILWKRKRKKKNKSKRETLRRLKEKQKKIQQDLERIETDENYQ